jgi:hypothetical protein
MNLRFLKLPMNQKMNLILKTLRFQKLLKYPLNHSMQNYQMYLLYLKLLMNQKLLKNPS